jgi:hypothetical protein
MHAREEVGLQLMVASLAGVAPNEAQKAKLLYLRNALTELRAQKETARNFRRFQLLMFLIPFFWPILFLQRSMLNRGVALAQEKVRNALAVWRDDLGHEAASLEAELQRIAASD